MFVESYAGSGCCEACAVLEMREEFQPSWFMKCMRKMSDGGTVHVVEHEEVGRGE